MQTVRDGWPSESNDDACSRRTTDVARDRTLRLGVFDSTQPQLCRYRYSLITPQFPKLDFRLDPIVALTLGRFSVNLGTPKQRLNLDLIETHTELNPIYAILWRFQSRGKEPSDAWKRDSQFGRGNEADVVWLSILPT